MGDLTKMSIEELEELNRELMAQKAAVRERQREVAHELSHRLEERRASQVLGREVRLVRPDGIDSDEHVNGG